MKSPSRSNQALAAAQIDAADIQALLGYVLERTGLDFRQYAAASVRRRVNVAMHEVGAATIPELLAQVRGDDTALQRLTQKLTLPVTAMFRDPNFFAAFREQVVPLLRTHPYLRLWVAGCSSGQEVYSLAILLHEEGLYERARIYATDVRAVAIEQARNAIFPLSAMQDYTRNYQQAGGRASFSDYYTADGEAAIMRTFLKDNIVFGMHNLVTDGSFNEFQTIFCRNVMIYFNADLQARSHRLLYDSLAMFGYLGLGRGETVRFSPFEDRYEVVLGRERLYRKIL
jgi:chemotaxis protein methyltransferase CheR